MPYNSSKFATRVLTIRSYQGLRSINPAEQSTQSTNDEDDRQSRNQTSHHVEPIHLARVAVSAARTGGQAGIVRMQ